MVSGISIRRDRLDDDQKAKLDVIDATIKLLERKTGIKQYRIILEALDSGTARMVTDLLEGAKNG